MAKINHFLFPDEEVEDLVLTHDLSMEEASCSSSLSFVIESIYVRISQRSCLTSVLPGSVEAIFSCVNHSLGRLDIG